MTVSHESYNTKGLRTLNICHGKERERRGRKAAGRNARGQEITSLPTVEIPFGLEKEIFSSYIITFLVCNMTYILAIVIDEAEVERGAGSLELGESAPCRKKEKHAGECLQLATGPPS